MRYTDTEQADPPTMGGGVATCFTTSYKLRSTNTNTLRTFIQAPSSLEAVSASTVGIESMTAQQAATVLNAAPKSKDKGKSKVAGPQK